MEKPVCNDELRKLIHKMISLREKLEEDKEWSEFSSYLMEDLQKL